MELFAYGERAPGSADEPGGAWRKSSRSYTNGGCVEVATLPGKLIGVRDSKKQGDIVLWFRPAEWDAFVDGVRTGKLDPR